MSTVDTTLLPTEGPAAPPRDNGELVFAEPWESRAFGLAFALYDRGYFTWAEFQQTLIEVIHRWEHDHPDGEDWNYYQCWLAAVERLVEEEGLVSRSDVDRRSDDLHAREPGHDH